LSSEGEAPPSKEKLAFLSWLLKISNTIIKTKMTRRGIMKMLALMAG
jgi:hypothetical protein